MNIVFFSGLYSLILQIITGIIQIYAIKLPIPPRFNIIKELVIMDFIVQIIEATFYIWMITNFDIIKNITEFRYYDWILTTPIMLITLILYLIFLKNKNNNITTKPIITEIKNNWKTIITVTILNGLMLLSGFLGEKQIYSYISTTIIGFIPFILMFYIIYSEFALYSKDGLKLFWVFSIIWSLYGVAAILPYKIKNTMYNILDLFAKNFFGIFLSYILYNANKLE